MSTDVGTGGTMKVLVYSDDAAMREKVRLAIGRRPAADLPLVEIVECATPAKAMQYLESGAFDAAVLDGEARPAGGMGISKQAKDEVYDCPPVCLIVARGDDRWLAAWSRADVVVPQPIDPVALADAVAGLLRDRVSRAVPR